MRHGQQWLSVFFCSSVLSTCLQNPARARHSLVRQRFRRLRHRIRIRLSRRFRHHRHRLFLQTADRHHHSLGLESAVSQAVVAADLIFDPARPNDVVQSAV